MMRNILLSLVIAGAYVAAMVVCVRVSDAMQVTGQAPVVVGSFPTVQASIAFDLAAHTYVITYGQPPNLTKAITGAIPAGLQSAIEAHVQARIEANEGWTPDSSTVVP